MPSSQYHVRAARTADVPAIQVLRAPDEGRVLLHHELVSLYEKLPEFRVVIDAQGRVVGAGALHVMWSDLAEVRSIVVDGSLRGHGIGALLLESLLDQAREIGIARVFCLTFETGFFGRHGFVEISDVPVDEATFAELARSTDDGVAEFLDLARVKENTLGNTRMLRLL
ncbi:MAG: amino-acid N-acetyltransferase [Micrococcales bacterium]